MAQTIADRLRAGAPVLIDFRGCDPRLAGRLMDFSSGLVYALEGTLQHVGRDVAAAHAEPRGRLRRRGLRGPGARLLQPELTRMTAGRRGRLRNVLRFAPGRAGCYGPGSSPAPGQGP